MQLAPGTRLGLYEILAPLGAGGMGEVYRALDQRLGREIALKVLPADVASDSDRLARFEREARSVARLNHPSIVTLFSVEDHGGVRFLTMELVEGRSLDHEVAPGGMPLPRVIALGISLADALTAAHEKGVVHRDLKAANVMITKDGRVKVLDFGLAKLATGEGEATAPATTLTAPLTAAGTVLGTVPYMAPEQLVGGAVDARTDLFALGVILYEMVVGRRPFVGATLPEVSGAILHKAPAPLAGAGIDLPSDLEQVILRCLEKDPRDRFQTAAELGARLRLLAHTMDRGSDVDGEQRPTNAAPHRASIAVLPFDNLSGDPEQEYFADGMVEEIISGLSRIKWLFVIARNSTFIYKGKPVDVKVVGRDLGVRYVLRGSVRRSGNDLRVAGQLIDTETAANIWGDRYDGKLDDIFRLQDELTASVIGALEPTLRKAEVERAWRKRPSSLDAYDLFLRALPLVSIAMPEDADRALRLLEQAIQLEPNYAAVHGFMAWCHEQRYLRGGLHADARRAALVHAHAAIEAGSDDAMALAMGGFVVGILDRDYETAIAALDRSLALSPSSALAFGFSSIVRAYGGELPTAIEHGRMGIRLSPFDPLVYLPYVGLSLAHFFAGDFDAAASAASRAAAANPRLSVPRYLHAAALARLDRMDEARSTAEIVMSLQPGFTVAGLASGNVAKPERMAMLTDALRRAGLPG